MKVEKEFYEVFTTYYSLDEIAASIADGSFGGINKTSPNELKPTDGDALYKITVKVELIPR